MLPHTIKYKKKKKKKRFRKPRKIVRLERNRACNSLERKRFKETFHITRINIVETKGKKHSTPRNRWFRLVLIRIAPRHDKSIAGRLNTLPRATLFSFQQRLLPLLLSTPLFSSFPRREEPRLTSSSLVVVRARFRGNSQRKIARPLPTHLEGWSLYRGIMQIIIPPTPVSFQRGLRNKYLFHSGPLSHSLFRAPRVSLPSSMRHAAKARNLHFNCDERERARNRAGEETTGCLLFFTLGTNRRWYTPPLSLSLSLSLSFACQYEILYFRIVAVETLLQGTIRASAFTGGGLGFNDSSKFNRIVEGCETLRMIFVGAVARTRFLYETILRAFFFVWKYCIEKSKKVNSFRLIKLIT